MNKRKKIHPTPYIYTCARARAKAPCEKNENKKPPSPHFVVTLCSIKHNTVSRLYLHTFRKFVQKPYKTPIFYQFCKVEFTK